MKRKDSSVSADSYNIDLKKLLESGVHFGHKTSRWHPKMAPYIHSKRDGSHIIDLVKTKQNLETALNQIEKIASSKKQILLVGTKRQAKEIINQLAKDTGMPFVTERWLGGMLTNHKTMDIQIKRLKDLESKMISGEFANKYSKLELKKISDEIDSLNGLYGGIKDMNGIPAAVFIIDVHHDKNAVLEARKLNIPIIGITDTNSDPSIITWPIPANDDAIKSLTIITSYIKDAILKGASSIKNQKNVSDNKDK